MKKRSIIIVFILLIGVIAGIVITAQVLSKKIVNFTLNDTGYSVEVSNIKGVIATLSSSKGIRLADGAYSYTIKGDNLDSEAVSFDVPRTTDITVSPKLSSSYLSTLLQKEQTEIHSLIYSSYQTQSQTFSISSLELYKKGDWAAGTVQYSVSPKDIPDIYRFVLQKKDDAWSIIIPLQIAIQSSKYPNVSKDIIESLYVKPSF